MAAYHTRLEDRTTSSSRSCSLTEVWVLVLLQTQPPMLLSRTLNLLIAVLVPAATVEGLNLSASLFLDPLLSNPTLPSPQGRKGEG